MEPRLVIPATIENEQSPFGPDACPGSFDCLPTLGIWAADLFVVQTIGMQTLYVFFFISHRRRELVHFNVTANPTAAWVWRQAIEATGFGRQPQHLIHDRDNVYGGCQRRLMFFRGGAGPPQSALSRPY